MQILKIDPRALNANPDDIRQSKSSPQADALLLATVKAVGIIQPPVVSPQVDGGNGYLIQAGHRRVQAAIAAGLDEIEVVVSEAANDNGAMRSMVENIAREPLNPVDQWRGIERLVALGWTEEAIAVALSLPVRQIRKLRLLANVLPAMLDQMARGDMPNEQKLRTIASASLDDQKQVWKANKPKKGDTVSWWQIANGLSKTKMFARDASFGDDLRDAYGIEWADDLFGPADQDNRFTTNVEAFLGAQQEWMTNNLPRKGTILDVNNFGQPELPKKAERVYGKPGKGDQTGFYLDRDGKVQTVHYRMPEPKPAKGGSVVTDDGTPVDDTTGAKQRPDVTQKGHDMIGDFRTDALHDALARAPIEDDMLMALLVLAFAGQNVRVDSGASGALYGGARFGRHAARLFTDDGRLSFDMDTVRVAARAALIDVLSCRRGMSNSGVVSRIAGEAIGADAFLPDMGSEEFLVCLSRQALEVEARDAGIEPKARVRETRAALVEHFAGDAKLVHASALFAPDPQDVTALLRHAEATDGDDESVEPTHEQEEGVSDDESIDADAAESLDGADDPEAEELDDHETAYGIAAE
ncbi:ParB/RepB/Spo0J family partition protein [Agrobacterium genomosp. 3]|jgi:ParB/RepB/Spo0J family partition protein|nr:ParB/RepB/Spo0J family partition protein [Agrobacterium pusense]MCA1867935.1 ParB/RepB/Spo0J family partition protein [Agrobacterium tomkonis]MCA1878372.1 ParB/RepB/Spo0J family partition protein [Agrobacterium tumefaciens]MCA1893510.1 ParB/RepB/Spo0J family partition protein [Agrobacterium tomkonis]MDH0117042.1 ParB/RepB/Spo0J family partition protein [Agrobacterium pusense]